MPFIFMFTFSHFCGHLVAHHQPLSHSKVGGFVYIYQQGYTYDKAKKILLGRRLEWGLSCSWGFACVFLQASPCIIWTFLVTGLCLVMGQLTLPHKIGKENPELVSLLELTNKTKFSRPGYNSQGPWIQTPPKIEVRRVLWTNLCLKFPKWTCGGMEIHMCNKKKRGDTCWRNWRGTDKSSGGNWIVQDS